MNQLYLPMDYSDLIPENHIVHVVNDMVNGLSDDIFFEAYRGGGRPAYHPKMMTKIILFGYTQKWFSCRDIAKALTENLPMMWLAAGQSPDFRTINRFRSERLQPLMDRLFTELTKLLIEEEYVDGKQYFLDGTKMEANANKYSFVWKKSIQGYEEKLQAKIEALLEKIHHHIKLDQENLQKEDSLFGTQRISSESLQRVIDSIEEELHEREAKVKQAQNPDEKKEMKKAFRAWKKIHIQASTDYLPRLQKYEEAFRTFWVRNSYSKVDVDATFMRMKDDHRFLYCATSMSSSVFGPGFFISSSCIRLIMLSFASLSI
ncbi:transposase [Cytobacillus purgationiresistens]|uniref:Transposase n=1 Tax=Cytobacillus purgationiresistens TaxID=863449 RepID=A0ABU0AI85_9BACI|nr:transposase [Cytobacillus purgationiresistens]